MTSRPARTWRWLCARTMYRPRRLTVLIWWLVWLFSPALNRLFWNYRRPIARIDGWLLVAAVPVGIFLVAWVWWRRGRDARDARRARRGPAG